MTAIAKAGLIAAAILTSTILTGCGNRPAYLHFESLPQAGWHQDSVLSFTIAPEDTTAAYDILLHVRHTNCYPYQNMWFFVTRETGEWQQTDTLEFYLADDRGAWLGNGKNGLISMPVLYDTQVRFSSDTMHLHIRQGMRDSLLQGMQDVGVEVTRADK